jgi:putative CocE/NonD family hydrolase
MSDFLLRSSSEVRRHRRARGIGSRLAVRVWGGLSGLLVAGTAGCSDAAGPTDPPATARRAELHSLYVPVRDGTRIAIDVHLPPGLTERARLPTILRITRYWRAIEQTNGQRIPDEYADPIAAQGDVYVTMDVRGSGASFGVSTAPWSPEEVLDYRDVVDWIVEQPWSNGRVGAIGISYEANTAALLSTLDHPAVRAVVPRFFDFDPYRSPVLPGGLFDEAFIRSWSVLTSGLDNGDACAALGATPGLECQKMGIRGPARVDEDPDGKLLAQAIADHQSNTEVYPAASAITYRDDPYGSEGPSLSELSPFAYAAAVDRGAVPWLSWGSWYDSGTADAALTAFASFHNPQRVIIGAWSHGALFDADPYHAPNAPIDLQPAEQLQQALSFLNDYLQRDAPAPERSISYYTTGEGEWRTTTTWPPPGSEQRSWYLAADARLDTEPPAAVGRDSYAVNFTATTGSANRWATQNGGGDVVYPDRAPESAKLLSYTSDPLPAPLRVVGHPIIQLYVSSTREDGALFAYLEDVAPDGRVTYVTEGLIRLLHRRTTLSPYVSFGPQQSFLRADALPLVPGQSELVALTLLPVSALIRDGHRLRVSIAGHDADTFRRYPEDGPVELTVERSPQQASLLTLPYLP